MKYLEKSLILFFIFLLIGCFSNEEKKENMEIEGYIKYINEGLMPQTSNCEIKLIILNIDIVTVEVQIKKGETMWDTNMGTDRILITDGTKFVYLVGKNINEEIIYERKMKITWDW